MNDVAVDLNSRALDLVDAGQDDEALELYQKAIDADPRWAVPWFNLGLLHKRQRNWQESLRCNQRAVELDPEDEGAWWNLGIAATALGDWNEARRAWTSYGIKLDPGEGPIEMDFGPTPIRVNPENDGEVLWCRRIDPARAFIDNVPFAASGYRYDDLLLHDGEPRGSRQYEGEEYSVFNALELLMPSEFGTFEATVQGASDEEIESLIRQFLKQQCMAEDWQTSVRFICAACSEGRVVEGDEEHDHSQTIEDRCVGIAARSAEQVERTLESWLRELPHIELVELACTVEPAKVN